MTANKKIILGVTSMAAIGLIIYFSIHKNLRVKQEKRLDQIAEEGYETAHDILFPLRASYKKFKVR